MELRDRSSPYGPFFQFKHRINSLLDLEIVEFFQAAVMQYYRNNGRHFPWRETSDPYHILVSEMMLQQTQTARVVPKFKEFIAAFPSFYALARASFYDILSVWQGLGYNRRAKALKAIGETVVQKYNGTLPDTPESLEQFPGIGWATARSITAFAYGTPVVFVETNIRSVFLHTFFAEQELVRDKDILPLVEQTLYRHDIKSWYNALMDYGVVLKSLNPETAKKSAHYSKQSPFANSNRQIRGEIVRLLTSGTEITRDSLFSTLNFPVDRIHTALEQLHKEQFLTIDTDGIVRLH